MVNLTSNFSLFACYEKSIELFKRNNAFNVNDLWELFRHWPLDKHNLIILVRIQPILSYFVEYDNENSTHDKYDR